MNAPTLTQICDAVKDVALLSEGVKKVYAPAEIKEGVNDTPQIQIYPESGETDITSSNHSQMTFRGNNRVDSLVVNIDCYARQRSHVGEDFAALLPIIDAIITVLKAQKNQPYFELQGLQGFRWSWERVTFTYGDPEIRYVGARFVLTFTLF